MSAEKEWSQLQRYRYAIINLAENYALRRGTISDPDNIKSLSDVLRHHAGEINDPSFTHTVEGLIRERRADAGMGEE